MPARSSRDGGAAAAAPEHKGYKFESLVKTLNFPSWRKLIKNMAYFLEWDPAWRPLVGELSLGAIDELGSDNPVLLRS
jgi:hypothetical protein